MEILLFIFLGNFRKNIASSRVNSEIDFCIISRNFDIFIFFISLFLIIFRYGPNFPSHIYISFFLFFDLHDIFDLAVWSFTRYGASRWWYGGTVVVRWLTVAYSDLRRRTVAYGALRWLALPYGGLRWPNVS